MRLTYSICYLFLGEALPIFSFSPPIQIQQQHNQKILLSHSFFSSSSSSSSLYAKIPITDDGGVQKEILFDGQGEVYPTGSKITMSYSGSLGDANWSAEEVVSCWLKEQQGLDQLSDGFVEQEIDEAKLTNLDVFTEDFVSSNLGVTNKIQCKKLVMAAKRLANTRNEFTTGHVSDTNPEYSYEVGSGKLIRGMELGVASMKPGEWAVISVRSDYGYGSEGYRKSNGDVMVPPFATLNFEVQLLPTEITEILDDEDDEFV